MDIDRAMTPGLEHRRGQEQAVSRDNHGVSADVGKAGMHFRVAQVRGLQNSDAVAQRQRLHRAVRRSHAAAGGPVRLRKDEGDVVSRVDQPGESPFSEGGSACED